jgi:2,5-diamino-6-hydroxy-4-(5-phosphoribosylamino)pyrimidine 1'-reductase
MKPYVILNCAMSLDGVIGKPGQRIRLSNLKDKKRVHALRSRVDGIMVGINTLLTDRPKLTVRHARGRNPARIIVDSRARTPIDSEIFKQEGRSIIAVSKKAPAARVKKLKEKAEVIPSGKSKVNLRGLMNSLHNRGVKKILLEGGGRLNKSMLQDNLVDEISITITPEIIGSGIHWIEGEMKKREGMKLAGCRTLDDQVVVHYKLR